MSKVQIYNTQKEMWQQLGRKVYRNNLKTRGTLDDLFEKAMLEYKEKSGFNKRFLEAQEKRKKEKPYASTFSPEMVHLPNDEQETFNEQYSNLGQDLEVSLLVNLSALENKYNFGCGNQGDLPIYFDGEEIEYDSIDSLVKDVKEALSKTNFFGTKITPMFYTTREELAIVPEHISNDPEGYLRELNEETKGDSSLPAEVKELFLDGLRDFAYCKDKIRGLKEEECVEFERLYNSNTP